MCMNIPALSMLAGIALWMSPAGGAPIEILTTGGRNIYRLAVAELNARSAGAEIVGSAYDDRVCAFDAGGKHLWDAPTGGFIFDIAAGDLDGDRRDEVLAACADGFAYAFGPDGKLKFKHDLGAPVWQVAVARLDGRTATVLAGGISRTVVALSANGEISRTAAVNGAVRILRSGDFDGDGADEVAVLPVRGQAKDLVFFRGPKLTPLKERIALEQVPWSSSQAGAKKLGLEFRKGKQAWTAKSLLSANGAVGDIDGDGADELIYNPGACTLKGGLRRLFDLPEAFKAASYDHHYRMRLLATGDLTPDAGAEVVLLEGPEIRIYDKSGKQLGAATAPFGFTDVAFVPGVPYGHVILGSSPNGDDNLYRLRFEADWEKQVGGLTRRGAMAAIGTNLQQIANAVAQWRGQPMKGAAAPYDVMINHHLWSGPGTDKCGAWIEEVRLYQKEFPYAGLRFSTCFWPGEDAPLLRPDGKPWERDMRLAHDVPRADIIAAARRFEAAGCHFWVQVGHGCAPHCEIPTVAAILDAAPKTCLGFISAEDEQLEGVPYYIEHHVRPILELCLKRGKKFVPRNKDVWWLHWPADPQVRALIFDGRYRSVIVPGVEDSNSRTTDAQLAARVGLWLDGQVDDWCSRICADWFCVSRSWEWEYVMTGHPHLRYLVSQAALGARVFMFMSGERSRGSDEWTAVGREGARTFLHMIGKAVLVPPRREQLRAISPMALVMETPTKRFREHGGNGHHPEHWGQDGTDQQPWAFDRLGCYWAMAPLPQTDVAALAWGRSRRSSENIITTAPHGLVAVVAGQPPQSAGRWTSLWTTDGDRLTKGGKSHPLSEARASMAVELNDGSKTLPFRVEGRVFHKIIELFPGRFCIVLVDPGWLDPAGREVTIAANVAGRWRAMDRLTGEKLGGLGQPMRVRVPAGGCRFVDLAPD